jgi:hypothetical protein
MGSRWRFQMPEGKGLVDPLALHEICLELHMTRRELGERMSASELQEWLQYFAYRRREQERQQREAQETQQARRFQS